MSESIIPSILESVKIFRDVTGEQTETLARLTNAGMIPPYVIRATVCASVFTDPRPIMQAPDVLADLGFVHLVNEDRWILRIDWIEETPISISVHSRNVVRIDGMRMTPQPRSIGGLAFRLCEILDEQLEK